MSISERHVTYRWKIEQNPDGSFVARADDPSETIAGASREEVEAKLREKLAAVLGPEIAAKLELHQPGSHVETRFQKKISFSWGKPGALPTAEQLEAGNPAPIGTGSGSLLSSLWKIVVLIGIAVIIWLLMRRP